MSESQQKFVMLRLPVKPALAERLSKLEDEETIAALETAFRAVVERERFNQPNESAYIE